MLICQNAEGVDG